MAFKTKSERNVSGENGVDMDNPSVIRGETNIEQPKQQVKVFSVPLPVATHERLLRYQKTEARKFETQSFIVNEALNKWLDDKGFV